MYVRVKLMDTGRSATIVVSRITPVETLKSLVEKEFGVKPECQRMFFRGKQLEHEYSLFDYGININDVIQLMVINPDNTKVSAPLESTSSEVVPSAASSSNNDDSVEVTECIHFKVGDYVDIKDLQYGSWFTCKLLKIKKKPTEFNPDVPTTSTSMENYEFLYVVQYVGCPNEEPVTVARSEIRPRSSEILTLQEIKPGDTVLMNYNTEHPRERGYWFDVLIQKVKTTRKGGEVIGEVHVGNDNAVLSDCRLVFVDDIYKIKPNTLVAERTPEDDKIMQAEPGSLRAGPLVCITCKDVPTKKCKECSCKVCGLKEDEDTQILCDECDGSYHIACLTPPLDEVPKEDDWYCPTCKLDTNEIVKAGGKLKESKKTQTKTTTKPKRDWGKGMACVGRTKKCSIVPSNHFGSIPGVEVGTTWLFRVQVSEAGVHRPPVGGIHGRDVDGAFSLVLSGGYEDDVDNGDEFLYTGSGGRDLSGNKRTAIQSKDQELTRYNKALAINCKATFDNVKGATSYNWRSGKPIRVVRNFKLKKHSAYAPRIGNRYDGLYKVVKYYPEKGASGFIVWRFVLRRDDPVPAPWTKEGKARMAELGLEVIYPENYVHETPLKRKGTDDDKDTEDDKSLEKKPRLLYELNQNVKKLIKLDLENQKYWNDCLENLVQGKKVFLERVEETFLCICCQEMVFDPVTTKCYHNICKSCLKRSFEAKVYQCPTCRADLGKDCPMKVNKNLAQSLTILFPGYSADRH